MFLSMMFLVLISFLVLLLLHSLSVKWEVYKFKRKFRNIIEYSYFTQEQRDQSKWKSKDFD